MSQAAQVAEVLKELLRGSDESTLLVYQIAFDLVESEHQHFVMEVIKHLPQKETPEAPEAEEKKDGESKEDAAGSGATSEATPTAASGMEVDGESAGVGGGAENESEEFVGRMDKLRQVLVEGFGIDLFLNFLYKMNKTDLLLMKNIKGALEARNSVLHNVTVVAHGYMQAGTTVSSSSLTGGIACV